MHYKPRTKNKRLCEEVIPKCGKNTTLYKINHTKHTFKKVTCTKIINHARLGHYSYDLSDNTHCLSRAFGKYIFKTEEEALEKLNKLNKKAQKRTLLKEYEEKLNKQLNITDHNYFK